MKIKNLLLLLGVATICVFATTAYCQQKPLAEGIARLTPGKYDGYNRATFYSHVDVSTRAANSTESVGYQLTSCGTHKPEDVGALFVGKILPGRSFEILSLDGNDMSAVCWVIYKRR